MGSSAVANSSLFLLGLGEEVNEVLLPDGGVGVLACGVLGIRHARDRSAARERALK